MDAYAQSLQLASQFIVDYDDFLVIAHLHPDGDATGSAIAVARLLHNLGKQYTVVNEGETPRRFSFLQGYEQIIDLSEEPLQRTFDKIIAVDAADRERLGDISTILAPDAQLLNIDHHPTNTRFGQLNLIRSDAASTTEVLFDLIKDHFPAQLDQDLASALYMGLLTDTGGFRYANTTRSVMDMAAYLLTFDIQPGQIAERVLETISFGHLQILKRALPSLSLALSNKVAMISVSLEDMEEAGATKDDIDGLVSYPRNLEGVEVGVLFKELKKGEVKVSLRSKEFVDVANIAQRNGGGGHVKASGFTFYGSLSEAKQHVLRECASALGDQ